MKFFNKKSGFTLSEVMVTLSLIGVIATLTISTVGASVQQRARLAEFRAANAKMESALRTITHDDGILYSCYTCPTNNEKTDFGLHVPACTAKSQACIDLTNRFIRAMGATRFCENNAQTEGCLPENYLRNQLGTCFGDPRHRSAYVLDNSMIVMPYSRSEGLRSFAVDVNGRTGPNKWGYDIFTFSVKATESKPSGIVTMVGLLPAACQPRAGSGRTSSELLRESVNFR